MEEEDEWTGQLFAERHRAIGDALAGATAAVREVLAG